MKRQITDTLQSKYAKINYQTFEIRLITSKVQTDLCYIQYLIANQALTYNIYRIFWKLYTYDTCRINKICVKFHQKILFSNRSFSVEKADCFLRISKRIDLTWLLITHKITHFYIPNILEYRKCVCSYLQ